MTQHSSLNTEPSVGNGNWRADEARVMLSLLQGEYENSKRLSLPRRYKELQRIITMFTSEPVLVKMKWLIEDMDNEFEGLSNTTSCENIKNSIGDDDEDDDCGDDEEDDNAKDKNFLPSFVSDIKTKISKMNLLPSFSTLQSSRSFPPTPTSYEPSESVFSFQDDRIHSTLFSDNVNSKSVPTTPNPTTEAPRLTVCRSWPLFKRMLSESFNSNADSTSTISQQRSTNENSCNNNRDRQIHRRPEHRMCIIKKDEIPAFEIPPTRKPNSENKKTDTIIPSFYLESASNPNSPKHKFSKFRTSSSSPNIHRSQSSCSSFSDFLGHKSHSKGLVNKLRQAIRKNSRSQSGFEICGDEYESSEQEFDIQEAHESLTRMKQDFEELSNWNVFSRYRQMKKMLKKGGGLSFD